MKIRVGDRVRYRPAVGTRGYRPFVEADGRIPGVVVGLQLSRVLVELVLGGGAVTARRAVSPKSVIRAQEAETCHVKRR